MNNCPPFTIFAMMKHFSIVLLLLLSIIICHAQKQGNIWYFGDSAGLSFNNGFPVTITDGVLKSLECSS